MSALNKLFKNKDKKISIAISFVVGVLMLILSNTMFRENRDDAIDIPIIQTQPPTTAQVAERALEMSYESILERRLENALSQVHGVGQVKVIVRLRTGREIIIAQDYSLEESKTQETDSTGGNRTVESINRQSTNIIISNHGTNEPLIIQEIQPEIEGIIIIAEGGGDIVIKDMLIRASESLLGIPKHKIQVLRMR